MTSLLDRLSWLRPPRPRPVVEPGVYPYLRDGEGEPVRLHLRADEHDGGVLVVNAALAARLSAAGVFLAKGLLDGDSPDLLKLAALEHFEGATPAALHQDMQRLHTLINGLVRRGDDHPVVNLTTRAGVLAKPISADLDYASPERLERVVRRLWDEAIPHVIFVLSDKVDSAGLVALVELAEDLGMIAGVRAPATTLQAGSLLEDLAVAGVDHVNVYFLAAQAAAHDALLGAGDHAAAQAVLERLRENEVCPVAEVALLEQNLADIDSTLEQLQVFGVDDVGFFALATDLPADADRHGALSPDELLLTAATIEDAVDLRGLNATWYAPVLRDPRLSETRQIRAGPRTTGDSSIRVSRRGNVYAARGPREAAGNLLEQPWATIQASAVYQKFLQRVTTETHCDRCPGLAVCAADCPRARTGWSDDTGAVA